MKNRLTLFASVMLMLSQVPAWAADMSAHDGHDMGTMSMDNMQMEGMQQKPSASEMQHSEVKKTKLSPSPMPMHDMHGAMPMQKSSSEKMQGNMSHEGHGMDPMSMDSMPMEEMKNKSSPNEMHHRELNKRNSSSTPSPMPMQESSPAMPDKMQGDMSHDGMQHQQMPGMQMQNNNVDKKPMAHAEGAMEMAPMQGGSAPEDARDPHAYSDGYDWGPYAPPRMADQHNFVSLMVDKFEALHTNKNTTSAYDLKAWFGRDYNRVVLKAEGDVDKGKLQESRTEVLWGHAIAPYWDSQLGVRYDSGTKPGKGWLAFGVEGLAPYWFDVEATGYLGDEGRTALRLAASYDILFTQKLILKPEIEANFYGKSDVEQEVGSGLSDIVAGLRLRYHIRRELAPYVGVEWGGKFGGTADYAKLAGEKRSETRVVAGVQFWF